MGIKHYQEKNARAMEKELAQSDIPVSEEKNPKNHPKIPIYKVYDNFIFWPFNGEIQKVIWPVGGRIFTKTI